MCLLLQREDLIFFLFVGFLGKKALLVDDVAYKLTKVNYSEIYFTYGSCDGDVQASVSVPLTRKSSFQQGISAVYS